MNQSGQPLPQARTKDLVIREMPDEVLVYDLNSHRAHCLNRAAAAVWKYCDGRTPAAGLAQVVSRELNEEIREEVVWLALNQLSKSNLLEGKIAGQETGISRRHVLRKIGWTAVAVPLITSIIAPAALAALTCVGQPVGSTNNCACTNGCVDGNNNCATANGIGAVCISGCQCTSNCCVSTQCVPSNGIAGTACTQGCQCASGNCSGSPLQCQ